MVKMVLLMLINMVIMLGVAHTSGLRVNVTSSYPLGFYRIQSAPWRLHDLVELCLPDHVAKLALQRSYAVRSTQCAGAAPVIKKVVAVEGDRVDVHDSVVVNGQPIIDSTLSSHDPDGRPLNKARSGIVARNQVWVMSVHAPNSFDSRYFGPVETRLIKHGLEPVWTF